MKSWKSKYWTLDRQPHIGDLSKALYLKVTGKKLEWLKAAVLGQTVEEQKAEVIKQAQRDIITVQVKERMEKRNKTIQYTTKGKIIMAGIIIGIVLICIKFLKLVH